MNEQPQEIVDKLTKVIVPGVEVAFESYVDGERAGTIFCIYIGTKWHGPVLSWRDGCWTNLYSNGNYGKNFVCGGTWSSSSHSGPGSRCFPTIENALTDRDYLVGSIKCKSWEKFPGELLTLLGPLSGRIEPEPAGGLLAEILARLEAKEGCHGN